VIQRQVGSPKELMDLSRQVEQIWSETHSSQRKFPHFEQAGLLGSIS
jgi:hypothetical protein